MLANSFEIVADDGFRLFARRWKPEGPMAGGVGIVHGLGEHSGRYCEVAARLAESGYCVIAFDQRGHGQTAGKRGHVDGYDRLLGDIAVLHAELPAECPAFLYGQSLGGNLVLNYALRRKPDLAGIVATSPLLRTTSEPPRWKRSAARVLYRLYPSFTFDAGVKAEDLSRDVDVVRAHEADPLVHSRVSARLALEMLEAGVYALKHAPQLTIPLLLLHGEHDQITSCAHSRQFARRSKCDFVVSEDGLHELHWELDRDRTMSTIIAWLDKHRS